MWKNNKKKSLINDLDITIKTKIRIKFIKNAIIINNNIEIKCSILTPFGVWNKWLNKKTS